jgi:hypothetical protein
MYLNFLLNYPPVEGSRERHEHWKKIALSFTGVLYPLEFVAELNKPGFVSVTCYNMARSVAATL